MGRTVTKTVTKPTAEALLSATPGLDVNDENIAQLQVFIEAMHIYQEREASRGGLWKDAGAKDSAHHLGSKARRITFAVEHNKPEAVIDDGLDAINYAAFAVRNVRAGRITESPTTED
jgi:hypothetical protein